nr:unnamed protein product [Spirometra erinaceieuropaei]
MDDFGWRIRVRPNSDFAFLTALSGKPTSFTIDNASVPEGSSSNPCKLPNSCWQLLNDRQYAILESGAVSGTGSILVNPVDGSKSGSKLIVRDTNGTAMGPKLQNNAGSVEVLEMDPNMNTVAYILYSENVKSTTVNGNIVFTNEAGGHSKKRQLTVPYIDAAFKGKDALFLTGHIGNESLNYEIKLSTNDTATFTVVPNLPLTVTGTIYETPATILIDIGAIRSVLPSPHILITHSPPSDIQLVTADGSPLRCTGTQQVSIVLPNCTAVHPILVSPDIAVDAIVGFDFLRAHQLIIDPNNFAVVLRSRSAISNIFVDVSTLDTTPPN